MYESLSMFFVRCVVLYSCLILFVFLFLSLADEIKLLKIHPVVYLRQDMDNEVSLFLTQPRPNIDLVCTTLLKLSVSVYHIVFVTVRAVRIAARLRIEIYLLTYLLFA